jgi:hypothetical protein
VAPLVVLAACGGQAASDNHSSNGTQKTAITQTSKQESPSNKSFVKVQTFTFKDDGTIPNNPYFQVLIYPGAFKGRTGQIVKTFEKNNWGNNWVDGVFPYHHFHSTSH